MGQYFSSLMEYDFENKYPPGTTQLKVTDQKFERIKNIETYSYLIDVDLSDNKLVKLQREIGKLPYLTTLNCQNNKIKKISDGIGKLTQIQYLYLRHNQIIEIPSCFTHMKALKRLDMSHNKITRISSSLSYLTQLTNVDLSHNTIKTIPKNINKLVNVIRIDLSNNSIDTIPNEIGELPELSDLYLSDNKITTIPSVIGNLYKLFALILHGNQITYVPDIIQNLTNLRYLFINDNKIKELPEGLTKLTDCIINYDGNPIESHSQSLSEYLEKQDVLVNNLYDDKQNVHNSQIKANVKESLRHLQNDYCLLTLEEAIQQIKNDSYLTSNTKKMLEEYSKDETVHSDYNISYGGLLVLVWNRASGNRAIKEIINHEISASYKQCFSGRLARLLNSLVGFFDDIMIGIDEEQQIMNIITNVQRKLLAKNKTINNKEWRDTTLKELIDRGLDKNEIYPWIQYIN